MNIKNILVFVALNFIVNICNGEFEPLSQPLKDDQKPLTTDILNLYGVALNDPCSYDVFSCYNIPKNDQDPTAYVGQVVGEINISNLGKQYTISDLSPFALSLEYLNIIDDQVTVGDSFWNSIDQFTKLKKIRISKQSSTIGSTSFPQQLEEIVIDNYGGQVSDVFFNSNLKSLVINGALSGFSYNTQFPSNSKLQNLYLVVTSSFPSGFDGLKGLNTLGLKIDNQKSLSAFTIPNEFNKLSNLDSLSFLFTTDNPVYTFPSSVQNIPSMKSLFISGNGFATPSSGFNYDFTKNQNIRLDFNGLSNLLSCSQKPCIKVNANSKIGTVDSSYSFTNIDLTNFVTIHITGNTIEQPLPAISYDKISYAAFINSGFNGAIPDGYCSVNFRKYRLFNNKLTSAPSCLSCAMYSDEVSSVLLPNGFSKPSSPCVNKKEVKVSTNGAQTSIEGLGFETNLSSTNGKIVIAPSLSISKLNSLITVNAFPGEGSSNLFKYNLNGVELELTVSYEPPVINDQKVNTDSITLMGTGFSTIGKNTAVIHYFDRTTTLYITSSDSVTLNIPRDTIEELISEQDGYELSVVVTVADQVSSNYTIGNPDFPSSSSILSPMSIFNIILVSLCFVLYF
ncbi:hypothetical protein DICPUDRAFT_74329 [Dictyostelium purpureum]|uniref:IPT/TIG domain-containing protein n=1 Tax=Dictyostelium purpureum TaxID=5786 RepID=F0Z7F0_DICPU|nr:uncharacterized protein DICPUDRAFT_74329 [Dictyostelium purpureum]EGC40164.1 hypothetical protein DICPUDRAFT_74329 [Dictyostelium purpureum]|eukprot:XP_003283354.1 hypothetical protein DICPUDRAFT_74329 [Dictyostelium purpureum]